MRNEEREDGMGVMVRGRDVATSVVYEELEGNSWLN